jgi:dihydroxy-acid dehydratase
VTEGPARAPHRSYFYAMGITDEEIHQPWVGVATCWNEAAPCNIALNRQAQIVKHGVKKGGGTPREFTTITVTDGIAMGHEGMRSSLASRDAIADTVELTMRGHCYDALVGLAGCDKSLPGMMMAMIRLNVPSVFIYGGSILPGRYQGRDITVQDMFEAVGQHQAGNLSDAELEIMERVACPSSGACGAQYTANTMACVSEAIGLALLNSSSAPAPYESRDQYGEASGVAVMNLIERNIRARDIVTRKSLENAARVVGCTGGSTNAALHLPAMAHEAGIEFDLFDVAACMKDTPYFVDLRPGGKYVAKDLHEVGGVAVVMKELAKEGLLHLDCITASGKTLGESLEEIRGEADGTVIYHIGSPITKTGGVVSLRGNSEGGRHERGRAGLQWPGAGVRVRGRRLRGREGARIQGRRSHRHPQRGPRRWPGHARDAVDHRRTERSGHGQEGGADHRRALLRRDAGLLRRPCGAGSGAWRPNCPVEEWRHYHTERPDRRIVGECVGRRDVSTAC